MRFGSMNNTKKKARMDKARNRVDVLFEVKATHTASGETRCGILLYLLRTSQASCVRPEKLTYGDRQSRTVLQLIWNVETRHANHLHIAIRILLPYH